MAKTYLQESIGMLSYLTSQYNEYSRCLALCYALCASDEVRSRNIDMKSAARKHLEYYADLIGAELEYEDISTNIADYSIEYTWCTSTFMY